MTSKESPSLSYLVLSSIEETKAHLNVVGMNSVRHESNGLRCKFNNTSIMLPALFVHTFEQTLSALISMEYIEKHELYYSKPVTDRVI